MLQRRFREQERGGDDDDDENEKSGKKKKKGGGRGGDLRIHDLEEDLEMSSDDSDSSMGDGKKKERNGMGFKTATTNRIYSIRCSFILPYLIHISLPSVIV